MKSADRQDFPVSLVLPAHNEGEWVFSTVQAAIETSPLPLEIIVVDDESIDGCCDFSLEKLSGCGAKIEIIRQQRSGSSLTRNQGASHASSDILVFMDAHCLPRKGWLEGLLDALSNHPDHVVTPSISSIQDRALKGFGVTTNHEFDYIWLKQESTAPYAVPIASGACFMIRRDVFFQTGQFDNSRVWGVEDIEFSIRSWLLGHPIVVVPEAEVSHLFKQKANFHVSWADWVYNASRCALLHFEGEQLTRLFHFLESLPEGMEAVEKLARSDVWDRLDFVNARRRNSAQWFCDRFRMDI